MASWTYENAAHLLRRAAFGGTPAEIQEFFSRHDSAGGVASAVDELLSFPPTKAKPPGVGKVTDKALRAMQRWWLLRMINARTPPAACQEKLVLFWHGHLVSGASKQPTMKPMGLQNGLFRRHARGNFQTLVREFNRDPANLYYLDGITNVASNDGVHVNANENFSRELKELFTLGIFQFTSDGSPDPTKPNYTEQDVHQLARALTGWTDIRRNVGVWNQGDWDGGQYDDDGDGQPDDITIFGVMNNNFRIDSAVAGTDDDVLKLIFSRTDYEGKNQLGVFLSRKLWIWYAYAPPAPGLKTLLNQFADLFVANNFELTPLLRAMWTHDEFYSDRAKSRTVKNPADYFVQAFRAFDATAKGKLGGRRGDELGERLDVMGMNLLEPPSVGGWPGGSAWINTGSLLTRAEFAEDFATATQGSAIKLTAIPGLLGSSTANPTVVVDLILSHLWLNAAPVGVVPPNPLTPLNSVQRQALIAYVTDSGAKATLDLKNDKTYDAEVKVRGLISLALQTAESQIF
jgi:uncharacterized protein (DUF1800 family)